MRRGVRLVALLLYACGGEGEPSDEEQLVGMWLREAEGQLDCAVGLSFQDDGAYEHDIICSLTGGGYGMEARVGDWTIEGGRLRLVVRASSCGSSDHGQDGMLVYDFPGEDTLRLTTPEGVVLFSRVTPGGGDGDGGGARFGCFAADGAFTPQPIVELK